MAWRGDKAHWKAVVTRLVPETGPLLAACKRVEVKAPERRLVVRTTSKGARAMLVAAVRKAKVGIQVFAAITPWERANKALVYAFAQKKNLVVVDDGDRVYVRGKGTPKPANPKYMLLSAPADEVQRVLEASAREIRQASATPRKDVARFAWGSRAVGDGRRYADVINGVGHAQLGAQGVGQAQETFGHPQMYQTHVGPPLPRQQLTGQQWGAPMATQPPPHHPQQPI